MKLTLSWSPSEIENILSRMSFWNKDPIVEPILIPDKQEWVAILSQEQVAAINEMPKQEVITKVITLPPIFDTKIERITSIQKPIEIIKEVKWKTFRNQKPDKNVDITFADSWAFYKRFVSSAAASHYFGKTNLSENIRRWFSFQFNGIRFKIKYTNNVCK